MNSLTDLKPPYAVYAYIVCVLLIILGILLFILGSHRAGVIIILLSLLCFGIIIFRHYFRRLIRPTSAEKAEDIRK